LKGVFPLHGVTGAKRRHEGAGPLVGAGARLPLLRLHVPPFGTNPFLPYYSTLPRQHTVAPILGLRTLL